jgi:hypothetical protein
MGNLAPFRSHSIGIIRLKPSVINIGIPLVIVHISANTRAETPSPFKVQSVVRPFDLLGISGSIIILECPVGAAHIGMPIESIRKNIPAIATVWNSRSQRNNVRFRRGVEFIFPLEFI